MLSIIKTEKKKKKNNVPFQAIITAQCQQGRSRSTLQIWSITKCCTFNPQYSDVKIVGISFLLHYFLKWACISRKGFPWNVELNYQRNTENTKYFKLLFGNNQIQHTEGKDFIVNITVPLGVFFPCEVDPLQKGLDLQERGCHKLLSSWH